MNAKTTPYVPLASDNAALILVDHQVGLLSGVRDFPVAELKSNVVSLAKAMRILKVPTVVTTTARDSMWGPTFPELVSALPDLPIIDRRTISVAARGAARPCWGAGRRARRRGPRRGRTRRRRAGR